MTVSPRRKTTKSGRKGVHGQFLSGKPPPADKVSYNPEQVGSRYGWVEITSPERRYTSGWSGLYVLCRCHGCGVEKWVAFANLTSGKSNGCQPCSQPSSVPKWLLKRVSAMRDRCTNPKNAGWARYGGRGIKFCFPSVLEGAVYVKKTIGLIRHLDIDRKDNNGDYAPGNLRYATRSLNMMNQRRSKLTVDDYMFALTESPYSLRTTREYIAKGYPKEAIIGLAFKAVLDRRRNWRDIERALAKLGYSISSTQAP